jgi:hypothetical protein
MKGIIGIQQKRRDTRRARMLADIQAVLRMEREKQHADRSAGASRPTPGLVSVGAALEQALARRSGRL